jgi:long-chain acyl-CoA synthetase
VHALPGDLTAGIAAPEAEIDVVCHCAASISFELPLEEAREINVEGTRAMLELARSVGARRFVHVSTAYVAGTHSGVFTEDMLGSEFRNTYEQTKCEAERVVRDVSGMEVAIARPSIVVGESDSGWTPAFNVLYWPLRAFARGLFEQVPAKPDGHVDVVPVDYVADGIAKLIESDVTGTFNLVSGADVATVDELSELACAHFDRPRPPYADTGAFGDATADEHGAVYLPYFDMDVIFDDTRTREQLGLQAPRVRAYFDTLMDYADLAKWGKRGMAREAARDRVAAPASGR